MKIKADKRLISAAVGLAFFVPALLLDKIWGAFAAYLTLYALAWAAAAWSVVVKAARNIRRGVVFDENFLMLVASAGAFVINLVFSDYATLNSPGGGEAMMDGVLVMLLYQVGEYFQALAVRRSRSGVRARTYASCSPCARTARSCCAAEKNRKSAPRKWKSAN